MERIVCSTSGFVCSQSEHKLDCSQIRFKSCRPFKQSQKGFFSLFVLFELINPSPSIISFFQSQFSERVLFLLYKSLVFVWCKEFARNLSWLLLLLLFVGQSVCQLRSVFFVSFKHQPAVATSGSRASLMSGGLKWRRQLFLIQRTKPFACWAPEEARFARNMSVDFNEQLLLFWLSSLNIVPVLALESVPYNWRAKLMISGHSFEQKEWKRQLK